ncbi:SOS response-associated peptidase [Cutibacterium modestum]|nr:SOS response-associated peptidase [Cutibacterium modestum]
MHDGMRAFLTKADLDEWLDPYRLGSIQARGLATPIGEARNTIAHKLKVG